MGRKLILPPGIKEIDFSGLARREPHPRTRIRFLGMAHIQDGKGLAETARMLKVHWKSVQNWVNRFKNEGVEGLQEKPGRGNKPKLPREKEAEFEKAVFDAQEQRKGGRINGKEIQKILQTDFNVTCSLSATYDTLHRVGLVWISARSKHPDSDPVLQEEFKKDLRKQ
ncbi:helix-turn-helix domain-containing protein [Magnetococcales bacterium HHB-1]